MMRIDVLTLFPDMFVSPLGHSILKRAQDKGVVEIVLSNIRDFAADRHKNVDDKPYGGGAGMVMMCQPVFDCLESVRGQHETNGKVIIMTPQGKKFDQRIAEELACEKRLIFIAGRYEGFDERIKTGTDAMQVSIGDYVLSGGELAAMVVIDAVTRLLPGVLGDEDSAENDSFSNGLLEYPHYTRPEVFRNMKVPKVLLSGNHAEISKWRKKKSFERTKTVRPDLLNDENDNKNYTS